MVIALSIISVFPTSLQQVSVADAVKQPSAHPKQQVALTTHVAAAQALPAVQTQNPPATTQTAPVAAPVASGSHEDWMSQAGISPGDYGYVDYIISHESGWCPYKSEGEYGACPAYHGHSDYNGYGLCQSTPPGKMAAAGADWETNPVTQMKWCNSYAIARYGGWTGAYTRWINYHNW